ncbi:MAG TPA: hypothetical protein VLF17_03210 [Candidatus Nitrosotenuis sp.]|nr:hypothetical protein [Candidatus Nitrosotenuis sp.]
MSISLLASVAVTPAYATRTIEVKKEVDVKKDLLAKQLADLTGYKKIFPAFIKDVKTDPSDKSRAKFIVEAQGTREADVKSTVKPDGTFIVEILSGDLEGSKITTTLKERAGFDGSPNGATIITTNLSLETSFLVSIALSFVDDSQIQQAMGNGFYELGQFIKAQHPQSKEASQVKVGYSEKPSAKVPKLESAKQLDLQKEAEKFQVTPATKQSAKTLDFEKESKKTMTKPKTDKITSLQKAPVPQTESKPPVSQGSFISLDKFPTSARIGDTVMFSGKLHLSGTNPEGATVYIKDEDPLGADDFMAAGIVDSAGRFHIPWTVKNMDADSVADVYAVFEGSDVHPRLTTCGVYCADTIPLATLR